MLRKDCLIVKIAGIGSGLSPVSGSVQVVRISPFQVPLRLGNETSQFLKIGSFHRKTNKKPVECKVN